MARSAAGNDRTPGGKLPDVTPGTFTYPLTTTTIGSLIGTQSSTRSPNFQATYAEYLRNSSTVEASSQPPAAHLRHGRVGGAADERVADVDRVVDPERQREVVDR